MKSKVVTREEALSRIHDGQTIMFGDWHGEFAADEIIDGMLEKGIKDIDAIAVSAGMADQGVGKLIKDHRVKFDHNTYWVEPDRQGSDVCRRTCDRI